MLAKDEMKNISLYHLIDVFLHLFTFYLFIYLILESKCFTSEVYGHLMFLTICIITIFVTSLLGRHDYCNSIYYCCYCYCYCYCFYDIILLPLLQTYYIYFFACTDNGCSPFEILDVPGWRLVCMPLYKYNKMKRTIMPYFVSGWGWSESLYVFCFF